MATNNKRTRIVKKIGTHSGTFHCDEALACFMLKQLPEYEDAEIVRSRNMEVLDSCDIVVDVGGTYNPKTHRYDHHQREFDHSLSSVRPDLAKNKFIKLSSAGLIYAHFGMEVISQILMKNNFIAGTECLHVLYLHIYEGFVEELDAIDNGVPMYDGIAKYRINTHLSARVRFLNPEWNDEGKVPVDELFQKAIKLVGSEFTDQILHAARVWWPAREVVKKAIENRNEIDENGEIILLNQFCPWKEHLFNLEKEMNLEGKIKFCLYHDNIDSWRVQGVPITPDSFVCRVFLHKDWRGIRDEELSTVSKIEGSIFCHSTGFIGGNKTKEGALKMAQTSLKASIVNRE